MKRFLIVVITLILLYLGADYVYFHTGWFINLHTNQEVTTFTRADEDTIYLNTGSGYQPFEIRGMDMGSGIPGEWSTDFAIDKETYLRWFRQIQEMGANTIRLYTVQNAAFYEAFYEHNVENPTPLYLIHGVWVNDYIQNSHRDAFDKDFLDEFQKNCFTMINVIHGNCKLNLGEMASAGSGTYRKDISPWVIGYILGVEWEDVTVAYTNDRYGAYPEMCSYEGTYMYTTEDAAPFEAFLAQIGDATIRYETDRYHEQRLVAFSNWPTTDPFDYPQAIAEYFMKCANVDVEHIQTTSKFLSGQFASYHVYPYYPDYLSYMDDWSALRLNNKMEFFSEDGTPNTYAAYLTALTQHHTMPVVISEFGVSTGRGMAQRDQNTGRNQGNMAESEQGRALVECYRDIMSSGCAGCCIFTWQDEWFKRTWNTMYAVDLKRTPYWSDYQTNEQYFGMLSFDPGKETSVCYVDGDVSEWTDQDVLTESEGMRLSMKYDEKFIYFYIHKSGLDLENDTIYVPVDTTQNSGSTWCRNKDLLFDRAVDFLITIHGKDASRVQVQEYYEALRANYAENVYDFNTYYRENLPQVDSPNFVNIDMILQTATVLLQNDNSATAEVFETGKLTYGNANPDDPEFNSLADFCVSGDELEVKLPWQLLNFADPSRMEIHDDYYNGNYGVDYTNIDQMYVGISTGDTQGRIQLQPLELKGWRNNPTSHERLKSSYKIMKALWTEDKTA